MQVKTTQKQVVESEKKPTNYNTKVTQTTDDTDGDWGEKKADRGRDSTNDLHQTCKQ